MIYKFVLPTIDEALESLQKGKGTSLDRFIYDNEPAEYSERTKFRDGLENAINYAIEEHDTFRLTTDAPEMTVGDSGSVSEHFTHEPCPDCNGSGINTDRWGICRNCNGEGMVLSAKPDDRDPSPTPSFRNPASIRPPLA